MHVIKIHCQSSAISNNLIGFFSSFGREVWKPPASGRICHVCIHVSDCLYLVALGPCALVRFTVRGALRCSTRKGRHAEGGRRGGQAHAEPPLRTVLCTWAWGIGALGVGSLRSPCHRCSQSLSVPQSTTTAGPGHSSAPSRPAARLLGGGMNELGYPAVAGRSRRLGEPGGHQDADLSWVPLALHSLWPRTRRVAARGAQAPLPWFPRPLSQEARIQTWALGPCSQANSGRSPILPHLSPRCVFVLGF